MTPSLPAHGTAPGTSGAEDDAVWVEAADWLVCLTSGAATEADVQALADWRARSAEHDATFRQLAGMRALARAVGPVPTHDRRGFLAGGVALASGAMVAVVRPPFALWPSLAELTADHRTAAGERYAFTPVAGVAIELNAQTSVALADRGRGMTLIAGEAFVAARRPADHFTVMAGALRIATTVATFNVQLIAGDVRVACASGDVTCSAARTRNRLHPGEQITVAADGRATVTRIDPEKATAWRRGLLIFEDTPLDEVVEQINRYRPGRILLTDAALGRRSVSGLFHTDRIEDTVAQIQQALGLRVRHLPGGMLLMG